MQASNNHSRTTQVFSFAVAVLALTLFAIEPAFAQGGLDRANTFIENVLAILRAISIGVVTIAIIWAGYKFVFKRADITEIGPILIGGLLIGGAAEIAAYLLGTA